MSTPKPNRYPNDPCLSALLYRLDETMKISLPDQPQVSMPVELVAGGGCNTEVKIFDGNADVPIRYNRRNLLDLVGLAEGVVRVPFIPSPNLLAEMVQAVAAHYGRLIALVDIDGVEFARITGHPNGTYSTMLRAADTSFGWVGELTVLFKVAGDLNDLIVEADLGDLSYP